MLQGIENIHRAKQSYDEMLNQHLNSFGFQQARKVKVGGSHFITGNFESSLLQSSSDDLFFVEVRASGFAGAWEKLANLLQKNIVPRLGSERDDDTVARQGAQVPNHFRHFFSRVVDGNIYACNSVVLSSDRF